MSTSRLSTLAADYKVVNVTDQAASYKAENIATKGSATYWRTSKPSPEASVELSFRPSRLHSIEIINKGAPQIEIVVYNKDESQSRIQKYTCVPKSTLIPYGKFKEHESQANTKTYDIAALPTFPKDQHFTFAAVSILNPHHETEPRVLGLQSVIINRIDTAQPVQTARKRFEFGIQRDTDAAVKSIVFQSRASPSPYKENINMRQPDQLSLFKTRNTLNVSPNKMGSSLLSSPFKPQNNKLNIGKRAVNTAYGSLLDNDLFKGANRRVPLLNTASSNPNRASHAATQNRSINKNPARGLQQHQQQHEEDESGSDYEAEIRRAIEESKKTYQSEQKHKQEMLDEAENVYMSLEQNHSSSQVDPVQSEDRENLSRYYQNIIYGADRMDEEQDKSTAIPWEDIEDARDVPKITSQTTTIRSPDGAKDTQSQALAATQRKDTSARSPKAADFLAQQTPSSYTSYTEDSCSRGMFQLQTNDYAEEYLEIERTGLHVLSLVRES